MLNFTLKIIYFFILIENIALAQDIYQNHIILSICGSPNIPFQTDRYWEKTRSGCEQDIKNKNSLTVKELKILCSNYKNLRIVSSNLKFHESVLCEFMNQN